MCGRKKARRAWRSGRDVLQFGARRVHGFKYSFFIACTATYGLAAIFR